MTADIQHTTSERQAGQLAAPRWLAERFRAPMGHPVLDLIDHARGCLAQAGGAADANERFAAAHLGALRAAAAVLAARARPAQARRSGRPRRGHGPRNVWQVLPGIAPELSEWASFFAANAGKRAAAQAGLPGAVTGREADDLLREADAFLGLVCELLGLPHQPPLDSAVAALVSGG